MNMSRKEVVVSNVSKEHDNPIAELVQVACRYDSEIILESNNRRINAKSIMGIMAFNPSDGMSVDIVTKGDDEQEDLVAIENFLVCE
jgi:phosphocarrier protein